MKAWALFGILAMTAMAGCMKGDGNAGDDDPIDPEGPVYQRYELPEDPMPEGTGHDHLSVDQHKFLWNYEFASRDPLMQSAATISGLHALDLRAGHLFGAVYGSHAVSVDGGLVIWDLSDPANPVETGRWIIPGSVGGDRSMEATDDGEFAVITTEATDCLSHVNPSGAVIRAYLLDTSDKSNPIVADVLTPAGTTGDPGFSGAGTHSTSVHNIGGEDYAFLMGHIYHIDRTEQGGRLVPMDTNVPTSHDLYVRDTPWNTTWAIVANGGGGMTVWDVTDVMAPTEIATWNLADRRELADAGTEYYFHTADVSFMPDGQIVFVLSSEDWQDHVSPLWVVDGNPLVNATSSTPSVVLEDIGHWANPGNHTALGTSFSLHNPRFHDDGILTISSYHAGLWQLDLRTPEFWADPAPIGYAVYADGEAPAVTPAELVLDRCGLGLGMDMPTYMDVEIGPGGMLYAADLYMGLYTFQPAASHPVYGLNATR